MNKTYWYQVCDNEGHTHHVRYKRFICEAKEEEGRIAELCSAKSMFLKSVTATYFKLKFTHDLSSVKMSNEDPGLGSEQS